MNFRGNLVKMKIKGKRLGKWKTQNKLLKSQEDKKKGPKVSDVEVENVTL